MVYFRRLRSSSILLFICVFGMILCRPFAYVGAEERCSSEMNNQAVSFLGKARENWQSLLEHQKKFAICDDGELGEEYSDVVVQLFARNWNQFPMFYSISQIDPVFQRWAIGHIDASASSEDLKIIIDNASACPNDSGIEHLCKVIRRSAESALVEVEQVRR